MRRIILFLTFIHLCLFAWGQRGQFIPSDRFSSGLIATLCQDRQGSIWIGTDYGLNRYDGYHFQTFLHDDADTTSISINVVVKLLCDREGRLWVGTNRGLDRFEADSESFVHYRFPNGINPRVSCLLQLSNGSIFVGTSGYGAYILSNDDQLHRYSIEGIEDYFDHCYEDAQGRLWRSGFDDIIYMRHGDTIERFRSEVGNALDFIQQGDEVLIMGQHGLMAYKNGQLSVASVDMSGVAVNDLVYACFAASDDGTIYIGTRGQGIYRLPATGLRRLEKVDISAFGIDPNTAKVNDLIFDRRGNLWLGCHRKGLLMVPLKPVQFGSWSFEAEGISLGSTISSVCEGDGGIIWTTVQGVGVYGFNQQGHVVAHPQAPEAIEFIFRDRQRRFWVGTDDGLFSYDPSTGRYQQRVTFECERFNDMTSDADGRIYISTFSRGFCIFDPATGSLLNHNFYEPNDSVRGRLCNNWIMGMSGDSDGHIWMGTSSGVSCYDPRTDSFRSQGWNVLLDGIFCFDVCELHSGTLPDGRPLQGCIAIGTEEGLYLYDSQTRQAKPFPGSEQLRNKVVSYIVQANDGDIWCSTSMGIWQYSQSSHTFIGHVNGNGLTQKEYLYGVGMHTDDDIIYFGHNDGLTVFSPRNVKESRPSLDSLQLMAFRVGDQFVNAATVINGVRVTDRAVSSSHYFTVSYLDHTITLAFSQLNFDNPMNLTYEYCVNNGEWIRNSEGKNEFTLSHLQPGTYRIAVRAKQGSDYTPEKVVVVTVRAPWYRTLWAYFLYAAVLLGLLYYIQFTYRRRASQQLAEDKMKFLINATHDIRSPLTIILAAVKKLNAGATGDALDTIDRNAKRILDLVNQILDVRKIDKQQMHLHCQQTDLVPFVRSIYKMFEYNAKEQGIDFQFQTDTEHIEAWVDRSQFDKVVANLLSNAFKYNSESGSVQLSLSHDDSSVRLQVADSGMGLDADSLKHIFDRFYQGSNARRLGIKGTGIGLNLCKMIVDMHHGTIRAENRPDGEQGAVFTVTLPLGNSHLKEEEMEKPQVPLLPESPAAPENPTSPASSENPASPASSENTASQPSLTQRKPSGGQKRRVLVVDDDQEIAQYIATELSHYYKFSTCANGKEGLKELLTHDYDLVVSDVMMPEMDGFTMLRMIKTNMNISHIPVIMLTSKADVGNRLEGLERGADAFLAKPFDMEELHLTIDNLIHSRQRLKGKFTGAQQQADKVEQPEVKGNDELLMERIMKALNKNLSNSDFNVDMLTQEVGISRAQLHRKMKEMTGISTSEFIRNIRLEQAARLLKEQKINVTQVAYTVGFSNLAHFSTIFRKHFGVAPSEYAERES